MRLKELRGLPVIDPTAARRIGIVADYQVDPVTGRIAALDITPVDGGDGQRILASRIRRVGGSAVVLTTRGGGMHSTAVEVNEAWLDLSTVVGLEVMGDDGNRIGHLVDGVFDQDDLGIGAYLLRTRFWERLIGNRGRIQPDKVHSCSRDLMVVSTGRLTAIEEPEAPAADAALSPLKETDRLATPSLEPVPDGHPVSASPQ
jgi:sporulation protein YlmC with PRC-barrel domain